MGIDGQMVKILGPWASLEKVYFSLPGQFQRDNLAVALTALNCLKGKGWHLSANVLREGLGSLSISGRLQVLQEKPLVIADAAHNEAGSKALDLSLHEIFPGRQKVVVIGVVDDKDARNILRSLGQNTKAAIVTRPEGGRAENWIRVPALWQELFPDIQVKAEEDIHRAIEQGLESLTGDEYLLVTGSFYVLRQAVLYF